MSDVVVQALHIYSPNLTVIKNCTIKVENFSFISLILNYVYKNMFPAALAAFLKRKFFSRCDNYYENFKFIAIFILVN